MNEARPEETIGQRLRRLRLERGLSQHDVATPGVVSHAYVSRIEAGDRQPSTKAIRALARKLGVTPHHLETGELVPPDADRELRLVGAELDLRFGRNLDAAEQVFRSEVEAEFPEPSLVARSRAALGLRAADRSDHAAAIPDLEAAIGSSYLPPETRPDVYDVLGRAYVAADRADDAINLYLGCIAGVRERVPDDAGLLARFLTYLAATYSAAGSLDRARKVLHEATEAAQRIPVPQARTQVYWVQAFTEWRAGNSVSALTYAHRAIGLLEAGEDTVQLARAHLLAAQMLTLNGRFEEAGHHLRRARPLLTLGAEPGDLAVLNAERAKVLADAGRGQKALALAQEADRLVREDAELRPTVDHALGVSHAAVGSLEDAERHLLAALAAMTKRRQWREAARVARERSNVLRRANRVQEALDMMEEATVLTARHVGAQARRL